MIKIKKHLKPLINLLFTLFFLLSVNFLPELSIADDDADLFGEMEETIINEKNRSDSNDSLFEGMEEKSQDKVKSSLFGQIKENFEGSLKLNYYLFFNDAKYRDGLDNSNEITEAINSLNNE